MRRVWRLFFLLIALLSIQNLANASERNAILLDDTNLLDSTLIQKSKLVKTKGLSVENRQRLNIASQIPQFRSVQKNNSRVQLATSLTSILNSKKVEDYTAIVSDTAMFILALDKVGVQNELTSVYAPTQMVTFSCTGKQINELINEASGILYIGLASSAPKLESSINYMDLTVNRINSTQNKYPELKGKGIQVSIKEQLMDTSDIDLKDRYFSIGLESDIISQHANFMATMVAGAGNSYHLGKGAAPSAMVTSSDFTSIFPDDTDLLIEHVISIQNHSYGFEIDNRYSPETQAYDHQASAIQELLHVFSVGNKGNEVSEQGSYAGVQGFANLSGSQKMAKNALIVGATNQFGIRDSRSSAGPTYDGRVKPELMAFGKEGSSDAAALVSGTAVLVQDGYKQKFGDIPTSDLVKAVLIAGANQYDDPISFKTGYGQLNSQKSIDVLQAGQFETGAVQKDAPSVFELILPTDQSKLRLVLCWTDIAGIAGSELALINDLDLKITDPANQEWLPWVLDHRADVSALSEPPIRALDTRNNVELITLENLEAGTYTISVSTNKVLTYPQNFALAYYLEEPEKFEWTFPTGTDICLANEDLMFRWDGNITELGKLEIRNELGNWETISENTDLTNSYFLWTADRPYIQTQLRMTVGDNSYMSHEFNIVNETELKVDYDCEDRFKLIWANDNQALGYKVYELSGSEMTLHQATLDTFLVLSKSLDEFLHFAIQPIYNHSGAYKSPAIDYTQQGVRCYYRNFTAELIDDTHVENNLSLTSISDISSVVFYNWKDGLSQLIHEEDGNISSVLTAYDSEPREGVNNYYAQINLKDGREVQTDTTSIYFTEENSLVVFPNPIAKNMFLSVLTGSPGATLQLLNTRGDLLYEEQVFFDFEEIPIRDLAEGIYILRLYDGDNNISQAKLVVTD